VRYHLISVKRQTTNLFDRDDCFFVVSYIDLPANICRLKLNLIVEDNGKSHSDSIYSGFVFLEESHLLL